MEIKQKKKRREIKDFNPLSKEGKDEKFLRISHVTLKDMPMVGGIRCQPALFNLISYHLKPPWSLQISLLLS